MKMSTIPNETNAKTIQWPMINIFSYSCFFNLANIKGRLLHNKFLSAFLNKRQKDPCFCFLQFGSLWCYSLPLLNQKLQRHLWTPKVNSHRQFNQTLKMLQLYINQQVEVARWWCLYWKGGHRYGACMALCE